MPVTVIVPSSSKVHERDRPQVPVVVSADVFNALKNIEINASINMTDTVFDDLLLFIDFSSAAFFDLLSVIY